MKCFVIIYDKDTSMMMEVNNFRMEDNFGHEPVSIVEKFTPEKDMELYMRFTPKTVKNKPNFTQNFLERKAEYRPLMILSKGEAITTRDSVKWTETKKEFHKREQKFLKKLVKR